MPPANTSRVATLRRRPLDSITPVWPFASRRSTARTRATTSRTCTGIAIQSSAPASSQALRTSGVLVAITTMTGSVECRRISRNLPAPCCETVEASSRMSAQGSGITRVAANENSGAISTVNPCDPKESRISVAESLPFVTTNIRTLRKVYQFNPACKSPEPSSRQGCCNRGGTHSVYRSRQPWKEGASDDRTFCPSHIGGGPCLTADVMQ